MTGKLLLVLRAMAETVEKAGVPHFIIHLIAMLAVTALVVVFSLLITVVLIYIERKTWAYMQVRVGPIKVGPKGILQPVADGLKLLIKEDVIPADADQMLFKIAPIIVLVPALISYIVIPFGNGMIVQDLSVGVLYILSVSSIAVLGIITSGWSSNNKYSLIGAMRGAAQIVSYEVPVVLSLLTVAIQSGTLSMNGIVAMQSGSILSWNAFRLPFHLGAAAAIYLIAGLAELNRTPFDLPEAESELVSGYNTEYSGMRFAYFFLSEWMNVFLLSAIAVTLFFGGWHAPIKALEFENSRLVSFFWFFLKTWVLMFIVIWIRTTYPRFRVDQLMEFCWKRLIPASLFLVLLTGLIVLYTTK